MAELFNPPNPTITRGDGSAGATFVFTATNPVDGTPYDLTGKTVWFSAKLKYTDTSYVFQKKTGGFGIEILTASEDLTDSVANKARITLVPADTTTLNNKKTSLICEVQIKASGEDPFTPARGKLIVLPEIITESS